MLESAVPMALLQLIVPFVSRRARPGHGEADADGEGEGEGGGGGAGSGVHASCGGRESLRLRGPEEPCEPGDEPEERELTLDDARDAAARLAQRVEVMRARRGTGS